MLTGIAKSQQQATPLVWAWDAVNVSEFEGHEDPSMERPRTG